MPKHLNLLLPLIALIPWLVGFEPPRQPGVEVGVEGGKAHFSSFTGCHHDVLDQDIEGAGATVSWRPAPIPKQEPSEGHSPKRYPKTEAFFAFDPWIGGALRLDRHAFYLTDSTGSRQWGPDAFWRGDASLLGGLEAQWWGLSLGVRGDTRQWKTGQHIESSRSDIPVFPTGRLRLGSAHAFHADALFNQGLPGSSSSPHLSFGAVLYWERPEWRIWLAPVMVQSEGSTGLSGLGSTWHFQAYDVGITLAAGHPEDWVPATTPGYRPDINYQAALRFAWHL
jgi:hypothetical protein